LSRRECLALAGLVAAIVFGGGGDGPVSISRSGARL